MTMASADRAKARLVALLFSAAFVVASVQTSFAENPGRLAIHDTVEISHCERFSASEQFTVGRPIGDRTLGSVGFNFAKLFLTSNETDAHPSKLQAWTLRYSADDPSLIARLGGEERAVVPLCSIYRLMEMGGRGGSHTDARSNFAYARSPADHRLMAIHWFVNQGNQWVIGAVEVPHPGVDWPMGSRVFSPAIVAAEAAPR
jgi:hypothetical protein